MAEMIEGQMIDLKAIETRCEEINALKAEHPWTWAQSVQITPVLRDRTELVTEVKRLLTEVERLREELERAMAYKIALDTVPVMIHGTPCDMCGGTDWQCAECLEKIADYDSMMILKRLREELEQAAARETALVEAANALVQRLAAVNLQKPEATALGNAIAYGPEVAALQDILASEVSND